MKKILKIILIVIILLAIAWLVIFAIDYNRCSNFKMPIFVVAKEIMQDGGSGIYYGLGYRVEVEKSLSAEDGIRLESIEMYFFDKCIAGAIAEIEKEEDFVKITDGKIENEYLIDKFIEDTDNRKQATLKIDNDGEILEVNYVTGDGQEEAYYTIHVNGKETRRDIGKIKKVIATDDNVVRVFFESSVYEFIQIICEYDIDSSNYKENFKLTYNQRKDLGLKTIIDKNVSSEYDFSVHTFGGDVDIIIEVDMVYHLKDALEQKVITVEDILEQAKQDAKNGICEAKYYEDGGSVEYCYSDYTILKYNTLDGNKDLIIGMSGSIINQVNRMIHE